MLLVSANTDENEIFDRWGQRILNMALAQGIPTPIVTLMDMESISPKKKNQVKASIQKYVSRAFPNEKISCLDTDADGLNQLR